MYFTTASCLPKRCDKHQILAWHYDFTLMTFAALVVYGFVSVVSVCMWFALRYHGIESGMVNLLCLYGYSVLVFIPAAVCPNIHT